METTSAHVLVWDVLGSSVHLTLSSPSLDQSMTSPCPSLLSLRSSPILFHTRLPFSFHPILPDNLIFFSFLCYSSHQVSSSFHLMTYHQLIITSLEMSTFLPLLLSLFLSLGSFPCPLKDGKAQSCWWMLHGALDSCMRCQTGMWCMVNAVDEARPRWIKVCKYNTTLFKIRKTEQNLNQDYGQAYWALTRTESVSGTSDSQRSCTQSLDSLSKSVPGFYSNIKLRTWVSEGRWLLTLFVV